jgi:hypothetical protein
MVQQDFRADGLERVGMPAATGTLIVSGTETGR